MNKKLADIIVLSRQINRQHLQLLVAIVTVAMLVVGIGAPSRGGGVLVPLSIFRDPALSPTPWGWRPDGLGRAGGTDRIGLLN